MDLRMLNRYININYCLFYQKGLETTAIKWRSFKIMDTTIVRIILDASLKDMVEEDAFEKV